MTIIVGTKVKTKSKGLYGVVTEVLSKKKVIITTDDDGDGGFSHWFSRREWKVSDLKEIDEYPAEKKQREYRRSYDRINYDLVQGKKIRREIWTPKFYIQIVENELLCYNPSVSKELYPYYLIVDDLKATDWYVVK